MKKICLLLTFVFVMLLGVSALADMDVKELTVQFVPTNTETADATTAEFSAYMTELMGIPVKMTVATSYNAIVDAVDLFEEEMGCSDKVLFIHPKQVTQLRKNPDFLSADKYTPGVGLTGEIGMIAGCRLVPSKKVPLDGGIYACPIVKLEDDPEVDDEIPALTIYRKREVNIETERKPKTRTTEITADEFYVAVLSNEAKVVLAKFKA